MISEGLALGEAGLDGNVLCAMITHFSSWMWGLYIED